MKFLPLRHLKISTRLKLVSLLIGAVFLITVFTLVVALNYIRGQLAPLSQQQMQQVIDHARISRQLATLDARRQLLGNTFYRNPNRLTLEGRSLKTAASQLIQGGYRADLLEALGLLNGRLNSFLAQCEQVNITLETEDQTREQIEAILHRLESIIADKTIRLTLNGEDTLFMEQLTLLLSGYQQSLLRIAKERAEQPHSLMLYPQGKRPLGEIFTALEGVQLRLRTLTASEPPIDKLGVELITLVRNYQNSLQSYHLEMEELGKQTDALNQASAETLRILADLDRANSAAAENVQRATVQAILTAGGAVIGTMFLVWVLLAVNTNRFFKHHIQHPMQLLRQQLDRFRRGNYTPTTDLHREDEWGELESAFSTMANELADTYSALRDSETRYRAIFENATEGIFQSTLDGGYVRVNPAMARITGFDSPEEMLESLTDIRNQLYVDPADRDRLIEVIIRDGKVQDFETRLRRNDGREIWATINGHTVNDVQGTVLYLEGTLNDITARKQADNALHQLRNYLKNIIDSMPSALISVDMEGRITQWNQAAEHETSLPLSSLYGTHFSKAFTLLAAHGDRIDQAVRSRRPYHARKLNLQEGNQDLFFDLDVFPLTAKGTEGAVIRLDDMTERARIEEMMVQSEKMLSVGGLAAGMAHEINNPLAGILQNTQVLKNRLTVNHPKNRSVAEACGTSIGMIDAYLEQRGLHPMIQSILESGRRAARIVENMLSFSRKEGHRSPRALDQLVETTLELANNDYDLKKRYDFRKIRIEKEFAENLPSIPCEPGQIQQVLLNLLKNAAQAMHDEPGQQPPHITIRLAPRNEGVLLEIEDNGPGMDPETRRRALEPFFTTKDVGHGTGLGLSISYFIITENHRGQMEIHSSSGQGCRFSIWLPGMTSQGESS